MRNPWPILHSNLALLDRGPQDGTSREDVRGRGLPGLGIGQGRGRQIFNFHGTSEDEDVQDGERDEDVRGRQFSEISGTSEEEDGEDVDVLRRPAPEH